MGERVGRDTGALSAKRSKDAAAGGSAVADTGAIACVCTAGRTWDGDLATTVRGAEVGSGSNGNPLAGAAGAPAVGWVACVATGAFKSHGVFFGSTATAGRGGNWAMRRGPASGQAATRSADGAANGLATHADGAGNTELEPAGGDSTVGRPATEACAAGDFLAVHWVGGTDCDRGSKAPAVRWSVGVPVVTAATSPARSEFCRLALRIRTREPPGRAERNATARRWPADATLAAAPSPAQERVSGVRQLRLAVAMISSSGPGAAGSLAARSTGAVTAAANSSGGKGAGSGGGLREGRTRDGVATDPFVASGADPFLAEPAES